MVQVIDYFLKGTIFVVWMREVKVDRIYTCEIFFFLLLQFWKDNDTITDEPSVLYR